MNKELEEVVESKYPLDIWTEEESLSRKLAFTNGAKWMQQRMYSEEDMLNFAWFLQENIGQFTCDKTAHFEGDYLKQFKKK